MALNVKRLRIWFASIAILVMIAVAGFFVYARYRVHRVVEQVRNLPEKYGVEIQQTANGYNLCKTDGPRTLFCVKAAKTLQYKAGQHAELQDVTITAYGRNSERYDQIYGKKFEFDPQTKVVTAVGEVMIDLETNGQGAEHADQAVPTEMKNPIHVKTSGLTFNANTGYARTSEKVEFRTPQGNGSAVGAEYDSKENRLTLASTVVMHTTQKKAADITAEHAVITKEPLLAVLDGVNANDGAGNFHAEKMNIYFRDDMTVERVLAAGNVHGEKGAENASKNTAMKFHAGKVDVAVSENNEATHAVLSENAVVDASGDRPMHAEAGKVLVDFGKKNTVAHVRGVDRVKLLQYPTTQTASARGGRSRTSGRTASANASPAQTLEVTSDAMDVDVRNGRTLEKAWTSGAAQVVTTQAASATQPGAAGAPARTTITATRFDAAFDNKNRLQSVHGAPEAKIVSSTQGQADRVTTSNAIDMTFNPGGNGIASIVQSGNFRYAESGRLATADKATYNAGDESFVLTGSPRYTESGTQSASVTTSGAQDTANLSLTATSLRLNRKTGAVNADGDVKTTYVDLKPAAQGAMLGSSTPIHVTAEHMAARRAQGAGTSSAARYSGNARLWQDANIVEAPTIDFDRDKRGMTAQGSGQDRVTTVFVQQDKKGKVTPVNVTAMQLVYSDTDRRARFSGQVVMKGQDATVASDRADVYLQPRTQGVSAQQSVQAGGSGPSQLQQIVAEGSVRIDEPTRRATGDKLVYTASEEKFVLTGGPPSIFDAEHGRITGNSLTFFTRDDKVLVEGSAVSRPTQAAKPSK